MPKKQPTSKKYMDALSEAKKKDQKTFSYNGQRYKVSDEEFMAGLKATVSERASRKLQKTDKFASKIAGDSAKKARKKQDELRKKRMSSNVNNKKNITNMQKDQAKKKK